MQGDDWRGAPFDRVLYALGFLLGARIVIRVAAFVWLHILRRDTDVTKRYKRGVGVSKWAVVTGAGKGIGLEFTKLLLDKGISVLGVSLPNEEEGFCQTLRHHGATNRARAVFCGVDATCVTSSVKDIRHKLEGLLEEGVSNAGSQKNKASGGQVVLLINNVGFATEWPRTLMDHTEEDMSSLVAGNLHFPALLTREILPLLLGPSGRMIDSRPGSVPSRSGLLFVSSQAGAMDLAPLVSIYGACKAATVHLSRSIAAELRWRETMKPESYQVDVLCVVPGPVAAGRTQAWTSKALSKVLLLMPAGLIARRSLALLGCGATVVSPCWLHALSLHSVNMLPERLTGNLCLQELMQGATKGAKASRAQ